jgi:hypothetical protein
MAATYIPYTHATKLAWSGGIDYLDDTIKVALVTSSYTKSLAHTVWADVSTNEVATGDGYTTGGATLGTKTLTNTKMSAANPAWAALTKVFRYVVFYKSGTGDGLTNPLLGVIDYGDDLTVSGVTFTVTIPTEGLGVLAQNAT